MPAALGMVWVGVAFQPPFAMPVKPRFYNPGRGANRNTRMWNFAINQRADANNGIFFNISPTQNLGMRTQPHMPAYADVFGKVDPLPGLLFENGMAVAVAYVYTETEHTLWADGDFAARFGNGNVAVALHGGALPNVDKTIPVFKPYNALGKHHARFYYQPVVVSQNGYCTAFYRTARSKKKMIVVALNINSTVLQLCPGGFDPVAFSGNFSFVVP